MKLLFEWIKVYFIINQINFWINDFFITTLRNFEIWWFFILINWILKNLGNLRFIYSDSKWHHKLKYLCETKVWLKINKKKKTLKRSIFQHLSFIRSLYKVVGPLSFSCITFFIYAPKLSKSYFILNYLKLDNFMFSTKTLFQILLKLV